MLSPFADAFHIMYGEGCALFRRRFGISREAAVFFFLALFLFTVIRIFILLDRSIRPSAQAIANMKANALATEAIQESILKNVGELSYEDFIFLTRDNNGRIVLAQVNNRKINTFVAETTLAVKNSLLALNETKIGIPLGEILGSYTFAALGPKIPVTITQIGFVETAVADRFEEAGINQVRHKIYLEVTTKVQVAIPFTSDVMEVTATVPLVDAIYPGEIPDTVINLEFPRTESRP